MSFHDDGRAAGEDRRVGPDSRAARIPRVTSLAIAIPVVLALGIASLATFLVGITTLLVGPRLRHRSERTGRRGRTITLDPSAYRPVEREQPPSGATLTIATTTPHKGDRG